MLPSSIVVLFKGFVIKFDCPFNKVGMIEALSLMHFLGNYIFLFFFPFMWLFYRRLIVSNLILMQSEEGNFGSRILIMQFRMAFEDFRA